MLKAYRVLAIIIAIEVVIQAMMIVFAVAGLGKYIDDGATVADVWPALDWTRLERHFAATAACGLCGRAHLESLRAGLRPMIVSRPIEATAIAKNATGIVMASEFTNDSARVSVVPPAVSAAW